MISEIEAGQTIPNNKLITITRKYEIADQINNSEFSGWKVSKSNNIKYKTALKYSSRVRKGLPLFESVGRPPILDEISLRELREFVASNKDTVTRVELSVLIKSKFKETCNRRCRKPLDNNIDKKISKTMLWQYRKMLLDEVSSYYK